MLGEGMHPSRARPDGCMRSGARDDADFISLFLGFYGFFLSGSIMVPMVSQHVGSQAVKVIL